MKEHKICITGGTGFVGRHLIQQLNKNQRARLCVLSRQSSPAIPSGVEIVHGDLFSPESLDRFLENSSTVIHLAFLQPYERNIEATQNLIAAASRQGVQRIVHCSTAVVTGANRTSIVDETTPCKPVTPYEVVKLEIERLFLESSLPEVSILRPTAVFGPAGKNLVKTFKDIQSDSRLKLMLRLSLLAKRRMNLVSVNNVVAALEFLAITEKNINRETFIISDDDEPGSRYAEVVSAFVKDRPAHLPLPESLLKLTFSLTGRSHHNPIRTYRSDKLLSLGFKKEAPLSYHIANYAAWLRAHEQAAQ